MNLRPSGYEPDELPGCSTPRRWVVPSVYRALALLEPEGTDGVSLASIYRPVGLLENGRGVKRQWWVWSLIGWPGDDLLSHRWACSTMGAEGFHGRVRNGVGWVTLAMITKPSDQG